MNEKHIAQSVHLSEFNPQGQWIQAFPARTWKGNDGRGPYRLSNPQSVIEASRREKTDLAIDRDHEGFYSKEGAQIKAAGWMKEFQVRDGEIWAYVEWTPQAQEELANKEYRYFSPEFNVDKKTGEITRITGGSLTNTPNFELEAVASMQTDTSKIKETYTMDEHLKLLATSLGLSDTASTEEIQIAAQKRLDELEVSGKTIIELESQVEIAAQQKDSGKVDPSKYVSIDVHQEVASQLKTLQDTVHEDKAEAAVAAAMKDGKIVPAQKDWAMDYAKQNPEGFKSYVEKAPQIVSDKEEVPGKAPEGSEGKLSEEEKEVASQLGLTEEQYLGKEGAA